MTERVERLRRRLASARSLRSIAGAMKALASVRIRAYREVVAAQRACREVLEAGFQVALRDAPALPEALEGRGDGPAPAGLLVFGSDLGLVGQFNAGIAELAARRASAAGKVGRVAAVGSRPVPHLRAVGLEVERVLPVAASPDHLSELAADLVLLVEGWRREGVERVFVAHHACGRGARYAPRWRRLLPLDPAWMRRVAARPWPTRVLPTYRAPWEPLFRYLVREQLHLSLVRAAAESQASEHAGRLAAMERAERRIDELLEELGRALRDRRQEAITEELLDLTTGYRASEARSGHERGG